MINPQSIQTLVLNIQDNLTTLANSLGSLGDSFSLYFAPGRYAPLIDSKGNIWCSLGFTSKGGSSVEMNWLSSLYPQYPQLWSTRFSSTHEYQFNVPNGVYQLRVWWFYPDDNNNDCVCDVVLNGVVIDSNFDMRDYCGGNQLLKIKTYPTFEVRNNTPITFELIRLDVDIPLVALELHKIGELT